MQLISCQCRKETQSLDFGRHLILHGVVELPNIDHFVATTYLGKVTEVFPVTPSGLEMTFKRSVWRGYFYPSPNY